MLNDLSGKPFADLWQLFERYDQPVRVARGDEVLYENEAAKRARQLEWQDVPVEWEGGPAVARIGRDSLSQRERLMTLGLLSAGLAHDLSNSLAVVLGNLHVAAECLEVPEASVELAPALEDAQLGAEHIHALLRDVRHFTSQRDDARANIAEATAIATRMSRATLGPSISVAYEGPQDLEAKIPQARLVQVLVNLLLNAGEAIRTLSTTGTVTISATSTPDEVLVEMADSGPGISETLAANLFAPFTTTKGIHGNGLGLWSCRRILEDVGGSLTLRDGPDRGAVFAIRLNP